MVGKENMKGHMVTGEPVNVSEVTQVVCDMSIGLGTWITSSEDYTGLL